MAKERDIQIDMLRCIGLLLVILAHVPINDTVKSIRSFDVMLLVVIAGISFAKSGRNRNDFDYKRYFIGRIKRLCVPTWITLAIIFGLAAILCLAVHREYLYSVKQMIESILFIGGINGGIGNVWIVRIYMLMAFMTPIFIIIDRKIENDWHLISLFIGMLNINEIIVKGLYVEGTFWGAFIENIVSSVLCYSVGFLMGIRIAEEKNLSCLRKGVFAFVPLLLIVQIILIKNGIGFVPNSYKYPPQLYYSLYGIVGSLLLYMICSRINVQRCGLRKAIVWLSQKSFDIYLAHTIILKILSWGDVYIRNIFVFKIGFLYYIFVLLASIIIVVTKDCVITRYERSK